MMDAWLSQTEPADLCQNEQLHTDHHVIGRKTENIFKKNRGILWPIMTAVKQISVRG